MKRAKRDVRVEFIGRYLSDAEADSLRQAVSELKPRMHLVMANWRWLEARGLAEAKAAQLIGLLRARGLQFKVNSQ